MSTLELDPSTRPDVRIVLEFVAAGGYPPIEEGTVEQARAGLLASLSQADLPEPELPTARPLTIPGPAGDIPGLLLDPRPERGPSPLVLWCHGGGFVTGGIATHRSCAADVARQLDLPVVVIDYRLAPEAPFPAAQDDAEAAARWLADGPEALGQAVSGLILAGDSAGGTLSAVTAMSLRDAPAAVAVLAQLLIYPTVDETREYPSRERFASGYLLTVPGHRWYRRHYQPVPEDVRASPLLGELAGLPPAVVVSAGLDPQRDQGRAYAAALVGAGVPTTFQEARGNVHGFVLLRQVIPSSQQDIARALRALQASLPAG